METIKRKKSHILQFITKKQKILSKSRFNLILYCKQGRQIAFRFVFLSLLFLFLPFSVKGAPFNLTVSPRCISDQAYVDLDWSSISGTPTYYILRKIGDGDFVQIASTLSTSYSNPVDSDKNYTYKIKAVVGATTYYSDGEFVAATYCPPVLLVSPGCTGSRAFANLNWISGISGNPTFYILRKIQNQAGFTQIAETLNTSYQDKPIDSDKNYVYQIKAKKGTDEYFSNQVLALPQYCPSALSPPVSSCRDDGPHLGLNWSQVSGSLSTYEIYRDNLKIGQTTNTTYDDGPNIEGTRNYDYFIKAIWQDGTAKNSETIGVLAPACPPTLTLSSDCLTGAPWGPKINLSWNSLLGVQNYQIYRKAQLETDFSLLKTLTETNYNDNLVESLATYSQSGQIFYYVKAVWSADQKNSAIQQIDIPRCSPYLNVESVCNASALLNPEMRLSWTATLGATHYNLYRDNIFRAQLTTRNYIDYLDSATDCPGKICTHTYKADAIVSGLPPFTSNSVTKDIDCSTAQPPSPAPTLAEPAAFCVSGDSRISLSWTASDNVVYYTLYRNEVGIINLLNTFYEDSGVESGYIYTYRVTAFGKGGTFTESTNSQTIPALDCTQPSTPSLSLSRGCETGKPYVNLSWSATTNTLKYDIYRGTSPTVLNLLITFEKGSSEFTSRTWRDTNVSGSTAYYYQVKAVGPSGVLSSPSIAQSITTYSCLPTFPSLTLSTVCESVNAVVNLSWTTNGANTSRFEIFREDYSPSTPIQIIYDTALRNWKDTSTAQQTTYKYKVEAVGYGEFPPRSSSGYKSITTYNCSPPGPFTLSGPTAFCQGSYPRTDLSWTASTNSISYDLFRNRLNPDDSVAETTTLNNVNSPYTDVGFGNALSFDGNNDYVNSGTGASLHIRNNVTVEAWVKSTKNNATLFQGIIGKANLSGTELGWILSKRADNKFYFQVRHNGVAHARYDMTTYSNIAYTDNNWHHLVGVLLSNGSHYIYIDGVQQAASYSGTSWTPAISSIPLVIGTAYGDYPTYVGYNERFAGLIDEVRIYNRALSSAEVKEHYQGIYNSESGLVGLWHSDEGTGQTVSDSSNFGNNGTRGASSAAETSDPTWTQSGLQSQTKYSWQARANGPPGVSSTLSNLTNPATMPLCLSTKPGLVLSTFCVSGNGAVTLRWSYTINTTKYEIYRQGIGLIKTINQGDTEFSSRTWTDLGLSQETSYTYYIKAIGLTGLTNQSDSISITTPNCALPTKPKNLTATPTCGGTKNSYPRVKLKWDTSQNTSSYTIYRSPISSPFPVNTTLASYTDIAVTVNTTYSYYVIAYGPGGASPASDSVSVTTLYCTPSTPSITFLPTSCESLAPFNNISWSDATTFNTNSYKIYRNTSNSSPATPIITITSAMPEFSTRSWKDNLSLSSLTTYYYWVKTVGPAGESSFSTSKSVTTYSCQPPPAPTLNFEDQCTNSNNPITVLTWNKTFETTQYQLYKNGSNFKNFTPSSGYYLRDWLLIGPFSYTWNGTGTGGSTYAAFNTDYLGGELRVRPRAGESSGGKTWFEYQSSGDYINFNSIFSPNNYVIAYAFTYIYSPINQTVQLRIGSDDGVKVFLNGQQIWSNYVWRGASPDQDKININLLAGINTLLIKVQEGGGDWGFYARITNSTGNDILANTTSWDSSVSTGVSANYYVLSIGPGGTSSPSNTINSNPLNCLPVKPDLTVTQKCPAGTSQLYLDWSDDPNTSYWSVYRRRVSEPTFTNIINISPPQTYFADNNVESGISYEYYLTAVGKGLSTPSDIISQATPFCYPAPSKPSLKPPDGSATPTCFGYSSRILLAWNQDLTDNTISYNIWRKNITLGEIDFSKVFGGLGATATGYTDIVPEGNNFLYEIEAVGTGADNTVFSDPSNQVTSIECSKLPPNPSILFLNYWVSTADRIAISLYWTDAGNEKGYKVFRASSPWIQIADLPAEEDPNKNIYWIDYNVVDGQTYEYKIIAYNDNGQTESNSTIISLPIASPGSFTLSASWQENKVYLSWTESATTPAGGVVTYKVLRDTASAFVSPTIICEGITAPRECYDNSPSSLESYYKVVATNLGGSTDSNVVKKIRMLWREVIPR